MASPYDPPTGALRGFCSCVEYGGERRTPHVFGLAGCRNELAAEAEIADTDDFLPTGYAPGAFAGRD